MGKYLGWLIGIIASVIGIVVFLTGKQSIVEFLKEEPIPNLNGGWELAFSFDRCDNPKMSLSGVIVIYEINATLKGEVVEISGTKIKEIKPNGDTIPYQPLAKGQLTIKSKFSNGHLLGKSYLLNADKNEIRGSVDINFLEGHSVYDGIYTGGSKNDCDGSIKMWRKN